jgi:hypothetical protein
MSFHGKCVKNSKDPCFYPITSSQLHCHETHDPSTCTNSNSDLPYNWVSYQCSANDLEILESFYKSTGGNDWKFAYGWNDSMNTQCCQWYGITCSFYERNIIKINLTKNHLHGFIPTSIQHLSKIQYLDLSENNLSSSISSQIGNLTHLTHLSLASNKLTSSIPTSIQYLSKLEY